MAIIRTGTGGTDQWTIDPTSKAGRVTPYDASGNPLVTASGIKVDGSATMQPVKITDTALGLTARLDQFSNLLMSVRTILVDNQFTPTLDTNAWTSSSTGSGGATPTTGAMVLTTGGTANSVASVTSVHRARLISGTINNFSAAVSSDHPTGTANNTQRVGCYDLSSGNGIYVQLNGTIFQVGYRINGVDTVSIFNTVTPTTLNGTWEISYAQGGFIVLFNGVLMHTTSINTPIIFVNPSFVQTAENNNSGGGNTNVTLTVIGMAISRFGQADSRKRSARLNANGTTVIKQGACTFHGFVVGILGAGGNIATIFDNTAGSGTIIANINTTTVSAGTPDYDIDCDNGLTVTMANGTAADVTVIYS